MLLQSNARYAAGSMLAVKLVQMPFYREVNLSEASGGGGEERIAEMEALLHMCQESKAVVCLARESRLSLELKAEVRDAAASAVLLWLAAILFYRMRSRVYPTSA